MSFLLNLRYGLAQILSRCKPDRMLHFEIKVNSWHAEDGDKDLPLYLGECKVTPAFLRDFLALCVRHECGD